MRRTMRGALIAALIAFLLLLSGCGYMLIEDPSAPTQIGPVTYKLPTPEP